jgi:hypothetical protein
MEECVRVLGGEALGILEHAANLEQQAGNI